MATYYATIPPDISAKQVFEAVDAEVSAAMDGITAVAYGDERIAKFFSVTKDEVFKACVDPREICQKIGAGASIGQLEVSHKEWRVRISRCFPGYNEDDCTLPARDRYAASVIVRAYAHFGDADRIASDYVSWLGPLQEPTGEKRFCGNHGGDLVMGYTIPASEVSDLLQKLQLGENREVRAFGEVQEKTNITRCDIDLKRYGFRAQYAVYPDWPIHQTTNYPIDHYHRFCHLVDTNQSGVLASVGRRYCAFRCKDGRSTRTLGGNRFDVYQTKTKRSLTVSFEQYADEDPPVRMFSWGVRQRLAAIGLSI